MATLVTRIADLATRIATETKAQRTLINGNATDLSALNTNSKTNLVSALNSLKTELNQVAAASGATINDAATNSTVQTYSVNKIIDLISTAVNNVTAGAPAALDTLDELAAALGDDANFAATITAALGNRLRVDAAQGLTAAQKTQGLQNLGAVGVDALGEPDTNFVTTFNAGLI